MTLVPQMVESGRKKRPESVKEKSQLEVNVADFLIDVHPETDGDTKCYSFLPVNQCITFSRNCGFCLAIDAFIPIGC